MRKSLLLATPVAALSLALAACTPMSPNSYNAEDVGAVSQVSHGYIEAMRPVNINSNTGIGGLAGAVIGGAAGSAIGGSGAAHVAGAAGGAVLGGLFGNAIEAGASQHPGTNYIVHMRNGDTISVVQPGMPHFSIGEPVMVLFGYGHGPNSTRIVPEDHGGY